MLSALWSIWHVIEYLPDYILVAFIDGVNAFFLAVGAFLVVLHDGLPNMPTDPLSVTDGAPTWLSWLNWGYPIGSLLAVWSLLLGLWLVFLPIRTALRWVKLL
jgi:hypothetical protein